MPEADSPNASPVATSATHEAHAYKALSTLAVLCLILGLASLLGFGHRSLMWTLPPATILMGVLALRQIASARQEWTGTKLAMTGMGLAVLCFLGAFGVDFYWTNWARQNGRATAERFVAKLKSGDIESAFWLTLTQWQRHEAQKLKPDSVPSELSQRYQTFREQAKKLAADLSSGVSTIRFDSVEMTGRESLHDVAAVLYQVHSAAGDSHVMVLTSTAPTPDGGDATWYVREQSFEYTPSSYRVKLPTGHGGHGH